MRRSSSLSVRLVRSTSLALGTAALCIGCVSVPALAQGPNTPDPLPSGATLPLNQSSAAVQLPDILAALDPRRRAELHTFVNQFGIWWYPFGRNQVIIASGRDYLVIGEPSLRYGRILARQPTLSDGALRAAVAALAAEQYDLCLFVLKPQSGGRTQESRLCDEWKQ